MRFISKFFFIFLLSLLGIASLRLPSFTIFASSTPWSQVDWTEGEGQITWENIKKYFTANGVNTSTPGQVTLKNNQYFSNTGFEENLLGWSGVETEVSIVGKDTFSRDDGVIGEAEIGGSWTGSTWSIFSNIVKNDPIYFGNDLVKNGDMELGTPPTNWGARAGALFSKVADERTGGSGSNSLNIRLGYSYVASRQTLTSTIGAWYQCSGYTKNIDGTRVNFKVNNTASAIWGGDTHSSLNLENNWKKATIAYRNTGASTVVQLRVEGNYWIANGRFDDISVKQLERSSLFSSIDLNPYTSLSVEADIKLSKDYSQAGIVLNLDSNTTPNNFIIAYHDGVYAYLEKAVSGVFTKLISEATPYIPGATIKVIKNDSSYSLYYNNAQIGNTQIISDPSILSNIKYGIFSTFSGNIIDNFLIKSFGASSEGTIERNSEIFYEGVASSKLTANVYDSYFLQSINTQDAQKYTLTVYAYTDGSEVKSSDIELFYNGSSIITEFVPINSGWYRLSATITGSNELRNFGVVVKPGKTVYVDNFSLSNYSSYGTLESSIYDTQNDLQSVWGIITYSGTAPKYTSYGVKVRTSNSPTMENAIGFENCEVIESGTNLNENACVSDGDRFAQYQIVLDTGSTERTPEFNSLGINFSFDILPPVKSNLSPELGSLISQESNISFSTDENSTCRLSVTDKSYVEMSNDVSCSGAGTTSHQCVLPKLDVLLLTKTYFYISCSDGKGNNDSAQNNTDLFYTLSASNISNSIVGFPQVDGTVYSTALSKDENILYVGGNFISIGGVERNGLAAIDAKTFEILDWAPILTNEGNPPEIRTIEIAGDDIYVGGSFTHLMNTETEEWISTGEFVKINSNGTLDTNCMPNIHSYSEEISLTVFSIKATDNYIYVGGSFNYIGENEVFGLIRLNNNSSCTWDDSWNPGVPLDSSDDVGTIYTLETHGDNVYVGGSFERFFNNNTEELIETGEFVKINSNGTLDTNCMPNIHSYSEEISLTVFSIKATDNYIYVGGSFNYIGENEVFGLIRLNNNSSCTWDDSWLPTLQNSYYSPTVYSICLSGNDIFVGGAFSKTGYQNTEFAKLSPITALSDSLWNPQITTDEVGTATVYSCTVGSSAIYVGGSFDYVGEEVRHGLATFGYDIQPPSGNVFINSGAVYTSNPKITLTLSASDTQNDVKEMIVCGNSSFVGCNWEKYSTTKLWTFENTIGTKTIYVKFKDSVGNISEVFSDTITLHTPSVLITDVGSVKNIPNKTPYTMYFTSQAAVIKGITQPSSTVSFEFGGKTYTSVADNNGNFTITLNVSRGNNTIQYYSKDISNNQSATRTITLIVGIEYFPEYLLDKLGLITSPKEDTKDETNKEFSEENQPNKQEEKTSTSNRKQTIQFLDKNGNPLVNAQIEINEQKYLTDNKGEIKVFRLEEGKNYKVMINFNGVKYKTAVLGKRDINEKIILNITEEDISKGIDSKKIGIYGGIALLILVFLFLIFKKRKKEEKETFN